MRVRWSLPLQVLQQLPQKNDIIEKVAMAFEQQELYDDLKQRFSQDIQTTHANKVRPATLNRSWHILRDNILQLCHKDMDKILCV